MSSTTKHHLNQFCQQLARNINRTGCTTWSSHGTRALSTMRNAESRRGNRACLGIRHSFRQAVDAKTPLRPACLPFIYHSSSSLSTCACAEYFGRAEVSPRPRRARRPPVMMLDGSTSSPAGEGSGSGGRVAGDFGRCHAQAEHRWCRRGELAQTGAQGWQAIWHKGSHLVPKQHALCDQASDVL